MQEQRKSVNTDFLRGGQDVEVNASAKEEVRDPTWEHTLVSVNDEFEDGPSIAKCGTARKLGRGGGVQEQGKSVRTGELRGGQDVEVHASAKEEGRDPTWEHPLVSVNDEFEDGPSIAKCGTARRLGRGGGVQE